MPTAYGSGTLKQIQYLLDEGTSTGLSDARLLERFVARRDEAAFTALVERHGTMVLNLCRAVLKDSNAADDAFQATFVLLFRKADSIRGREALGGWLHRVSYRVALQARSDAARRRQIEGSGGARRVADVPAADDLGAALHEEIERLPERVRLPVVLCDLEGMTRDQAAERLGWTEGSLRGRLAKGRELLRNRLTRRGITLAVPLVPPGAVPESLVATTARAAAGGASGAASVLVAAVSRGWLLTRLKVAGVAMLLALGATAAAAFSLNNVADPAQTIDPQGPPTQVPAKKVAAPQSGPTILIEGRILNLEGRPVAGATVNVTRVQSPPNGNLDAWIDDAKRLSMEPSQILRYASQTLSYVWKDRQRLQFSAITGRDGRFQIEEMPRDSIATASITGPGIETTQVYILSRGLPAIRLKDPRPGIENAIIYYGTRFDHAAAPARPIVGTIRDKDSGTPIPGVHITGLSYIRRSIVPTPGIEAITDARGRYQILGLPASRGFKLITEVPVGQPYVNCGFVSPAGEAKPGPLTYDMTLKRGILVRGRLTDKATGQPLQGVVIYRAFPDNSYLGEFANFKNESRTTLFRISSSDGRFTIPALPGRGLIAARAKGDRYLHGLGADTIKGFDESLRAIITSPFYFPTDDQHVLTEINPAPGTSEIDLELQVDPGRTVMGTIVDTKGQPIINGVGIRTLDVYQGSQPPPRNSQTFVVTGLPPGRSRIDFIHKERKLAGSLVLNGDETENLTATLQPWGTLVGRVVDEEGKPRTDVELSSTPRKRPDPDAGDLYGRSTVDAEGRFRIEGLVPGVRYDAVGNSPNKAYGPILKGVQVGSGEVKDLGDITLPTSKKN